MSDPIKRKGRPRKPRRDLHVELEPDGECMLCPTPTNIVIRNKINGADIQLCPSCYGTLGIKLPVPGGIDDDQGTN